MQIDAHATTNAALSLREWMLFLTPTAAVFSAFGAALLTRWLAQRKDKRDSQMAVFKALMASRKEKPYTRDAVAAFNLIDVVFYEQKDIVRLWHEYYAMLENIQNNPGHHHKFLDLLSAMASHLGYKSVSQTTLDKYYSPQAFSDERDLAIGIQAEFLRVLKNTHSLAAIPNPEVPQIVDPSTGQRLRKE